MEANIWLSTLDRNEALLLHDTRNIELSEIDELLSGKQSMLGTAEKTSLSPKPQPVKEYAKVPCQILAAVSKF